MPDTTIRDGALGTDEYGDWSVVAPLACGLLRGDVPCVVVTGRTADEVRRALNLFDVLNWISDPEEEELNEQA